MQRPKSEAPLYWKMLLAAALALAGCDGDDTHTEPDAGDAGQQPHSGTGGKGGTGGKSGQGGVSGRPSKAGAGGESQTCTDNIVFGLSVDVLRPQGQSCSGISVVARDGKYVEELMRTGCNFYGASERAGTYDLRVESVDRYIEIENVVVRNEPAGCHVIGERRDVRFDAACTTPIGDEDAGASDDDFDGGMPDDCVTVSN